MSDIRISIRQFANEIGISHTRVRQLVQSGVLPKPDRYGLPYYDCMEAWKIYSSNRKTWQRHGRQKANTGTHLPMIDNSLDGELLKISEELERGLEDVLASLDESLIIQLQNVDADALNRAVAEAEAMED